MSDLDNVATVLATVEPTLQVAFLWSIDLDWKGIDAPNHFVIKHMREAVAWIQAIIPGDLELAAQNTQVKSSVNIGKYRYVTSVITGIYRCALTQSPKRDMLHAAATR